MRLPAWSPDCLSPFTPIPQGRMKVGLSSRPEGCGGAAPAWAPWDAGSWVAEWLAESRAALGTSHTILLGSAGDTVGKKWAQQRQQRQGSTDSLRAFSLVAAWRALCGPGVTRQHLVLLIQQTLDHGALPARHAHLRCLRLVWP